MDWFFKKGHDKRSLGHLKELQDRLTRLGENWLLSNKVVYKELFEQDIAELVQLLVWAESAGIEDVFAIFVEKRTHLLLRNILIKVQDEDVTICLLKFYNVFFESIKTRGTMLYFMLSNNYMNELLDRFVPLPSQDEIVTYYISLLKNISNKLDASTLRLMFYERVNDYPIFVKAKQFLSHSEFMNRIGSRTVTLNIFKVDDPMVNHFLVEKKMFFAQLGDTIAIVFNNIQTAQKRQEYDIVMEQTQLSLESFEYCSEIFGLRDEFLPEKLAQVVMDRVIVPLYLEQLHTNPGLALYFINYIVLYGLGCKRVTSFLIDLMTNNQGDGIRAHLVKLLQDSPTRLPALTFFYAIVSSDCDEQVLDQAGLLPRLIQKKRNLLSQLTTSDPIASIEYDEEFIFMILKSVEDVHPLLATVWISIELIEALLFMPKLEPLSNTTASRIKTTCEILHGRVLDYLESHPQMTLKIYSYEMQTTLEKNWMKQAITSPNCLVRKTRVPDTIESIDQAIYAWLSICKLAIKLGIYELPRNLDSDIENLPELIDLIDLSNADVQPCVAQPCIDEKTCPPSSLYFVFHSTFFLLVEPDNLQLGKGKIHKQFLYRDSRVQDIGDLFSMDVSLVEYSAVESRTRSNSSIVDWNGYRVLQERVSYKVRLVFGTNEVKSQVYNHASQCRLDQLETKSIALTSGCVPTNL